MRDIKCKECVFWEDDLESCTFYPKEKEMNKYKRTIKVSKDGGWVWELEEVNKKAVKPTEQDVKNAILEILADRKSYNTSLNYAVGYCEAGLDMIQEALRVQCLYILNNITGWRHPKAKVVRITLKAYAGVK